MRLIILSAALLLVPREGVRLKPDTTGTTAAASAIGTTVAASAIGTTAAASAIGTAVAASAIGTTAAASAIETTAAASAIGTTVAASTIETTFPVSVVSGFSRTDAQSLSYTKGQNISPAYEGWEQGSDGSKYFLFGYMNRNWEEEIDVPVGPDNGFNIGGADQGQPTHFLPRRNRFVFRVKVPAGFGEKDELIWTLTTHGKSEKAYATLRPDYIVDDVVKASETGALGAGTSSPEVRANRPPVLHVQEVKARSLHVDQPLTLVSEVKDDGIPKPRAPGFAGAAAGGTARQDAAAAAGRSDTAARPNRAMQPPSRVTVGKNVGLHVSWFLYRGPTGATVTFDPPQVKPWEDTRAGANSPWAPLWSAEPMPPDGKTPVQVKFSEPGTYVLRCLTDDGALTSSEDVTILVVR